MRVRPGEINVLKDTHGRMLFSVSLNRSQAIMIRYDYLAGLDVSNIFRVNYIESAGLRRKYYGIALFADA